MKSERCITLNDNTVIMIKLRKSRNEAITLFIWSNRRKSGKCIRIIALPRSEFGTHTSQICSTPHNTAAIGLQHIVSQISVPTSMIKNPLMCLQGALLSEEQQHVFMACCLSRRELYLHYKTKIKIGLWYRKNQLYLLGLRLSRQ